jgi:hypothetical protein
MMEQIQACIHGRHHKWSRHVAMKMLGLMMCE